MSDPGRSRPRAEQCVWSRPPAMWLGLLLACAPCWAAGELVITSKDFPLDVGRRTTLVYASADRRATGTMVWVIIGRMRVGQVALCRQATFVGGRRVQDVYAAVTEQALTTYPALPSEIPDWKVPFPLRKGMTCEHRLVSGTVKARVEGPEEVEVPAGKFTCLVYVEAHEADGGRRVVKHWFAKGVGTVKMAFGRDPQFTISLKDIRRAAPAAPQPGAVVLSNFDSGDPLVPPLFPRSRWQAAAGEPGSISTCDVEPADSAAGSAFCLRWAYHTKGTWVSVSLRPSGSWDKPVDLSAYNSVSFYIKGLKEGACTFRLRAAPRKGERPRSWDVPVNVTTQWRRVEIRLTAEPGLRGIDLTKTYTLGFADSSGGYASNVVWIDEVLLHPAKPGDRDQDRRSKK